MANTPLINEPFAKRWLAQDLNWQLGNLASDLSRCLNWYHAGKHDLWLRALDKATDLLRLSLTSPMSASRRRELARFKELLCMWRADQLFDVVDPNWFLVYCTPFARLARKTDAAINPQLGRK